MRSRSPPFIQEIINDGGLVARTQARSGREGRDVAMARATYHVCTLPGDGIGPEIIAEAKKVLAAVGEKHDVEFVCEDQLIGGAGD